MTLRISLVLARLAAVAMVSCTAWAQETETMKVLMLGDSHTRRGLPAAVSTAMTSAGRSAWMFVNAGVGGETAQRGKDRIGVLLKDENPDAVTILYGANDMGENETSEEFRRHLLGIIEAIQRHRPKDPRDASARLPPPQVILLTGPPTDPRRYSATTASRYDAPEGVDRVLDLHYYSVIREVAAKANLPLIDLHRFLAAEEDWPTKLLEDGVHLTEQGCQAAGAHVAQALVAWCDAEIAQDASAIKARDEAAAKLKGMMPATARASDPAVRQELLAKLEEIWKQCPYLPAQAAVWQAVYYAGAPAAPAATPATPAPVTTTPEETSVK